MKILGHAYVSTRAIEGNKRQLIIGSVLPEMLPYISSGMGNIEANGVPKYIPNDVFGYKELHEGGERWLKYLNNYHPEKRNLALGLMSHGVKFGADKYAKELVSYVGEEKRRIIKKIKIADSINFKFAQVRLHNFLGLGIDWLLIKNKPDLVKKVQKTLVEIDTAEISILLAQGFNKNRTKVKTMVKTLFKKIYRSEDLNSAKGLARIWSRQASGLPEKDKVDIQKTGELIQECAELLEKNWQEYLEEVSLKVKRNLQPFCS